MFSKLLENFTGKRQCPKEQAEKELRAKQLVAAPHTDRPRGGVKLDSTRIRLVVFRDNEGRGKKPVFDSSINIVPSVDNEPTYTPSSLTQSLCNNLREDSLLSLSGSLTSSRRPFLERRPSSDTELLGEMMFGSMPMKLAGSSLKIHYISSQEQLLVTKVFHMQRKPTMASCSITDLSDSCPLSAETSSQGIDSSCGPVPKHSGFQYSLRPPSPTESKSHSSITTPPSPTASLPISISPNSSPSTTGVSSSSLTSSLTRRMQRARSTSFESGSGLYHRVFRPSEQSHPRRGKKYALGVVFNLHDLREDEKQAFQEFLFSHFPLINAHLEHLREGIEEAVSFRRHQLTDHIIKCYLKFLEDFIALHSAPRMKDPVWLSIVGQPDSRREVCGRLLRELISTINEFDTKDTKHFLSTLVTAVLAHHLAWVFTVNKSDSSTAGRHHDKMVPKSHTLLAESNSYNPLWAQLGDLFGAVSNPLTVSRTIITGKNVAVICRLLYVISYFIRCSEVEFDGAHCTSDLYQQSGLDDSVCSEMTHDSMSNVTDVNESGRHSACQSSIGREALVIRPHPYSFSRASSRSRHSSRSESIASEIPYIASSLTGSPSASSLDQRGGSIRPQSVTSRTSFGSVPAQLPHPSTATLSPTSSSFIGGAGTGCSDGTTLTGRKREDSCPSSSLSLPPNDQSHVSPVRPSQERTEEIAEDKPARVNCHFNPRPNCCARERQFESMGMCPINNGFRYFNPSSHCTTSSPPYAPYTTSPVEYPPYISNDSLSTGCHTLSRNGSGSSFFSQSYSHVTPSTPPTNAPPPPSSTRFRPGSVDSGVFDTAPVVGGATEPADSLQSSGFASRGSRPNSALSKRALFTTQPQCNGGTESSLTTAATKGPSNGLVLHCKNGFCSLPSSPSVTPYPPSTTPTRRESLTPSTTPRVTSPDMPPQPGVSSKVKKLFRTIEHSRAPPKCSSPSMLSPQSMSPKDRSNSSPVLPSSTAVETIPRNNSYRGLPLASGYCPDLEEDKEEEIGVEEECDIGLHMNALEVHSVNVEESLSPRSMSLASVSPGPLARKLKQYQQSMEEERMQFAEQFNEFTQVDMTSVEDEFSLDVTASASTSSVAAASTQPHSQDFGRSLVGGYSDNYQPDLVLQATSAPVSKFKERLITDLSSMVKHSVVDDPVQHGIAIVADTDSWTCQLIAVSKSPRTTDVEISTGVMSPAPSVKQMLQSVKGLWGMKMTSQFCLSHLEDKLLELNEQGQMLASSLLEDNSRHDVRTNLAKLFSVMNIPSKDQSLLLSLASLHAGSTDPLVSRALTEIVHHNLLH